MPCMFTESNWGAVVVLLPIMSPDSVLYEIIYQVPPSIRESGLWRWGCVLKVPLHRTTNYKLTTKEQPHLKSLKTVLAEDLKTGVPPSTPSLFSISHHTGPTVATATASCPKYKIHLCKLVSHYLQRGNLYHTSHIITRQSYSTLLASFPGCSHWLLTVWKYCKRSNSGGGNGLGTRLPVL